MATRRNGVGLALGFLVCGTTGAAHATMLATAQAPQTGPPGFMFADTTALSLTPGKSKVVILVNGSAATADVTVIVDGLTSEISTSPASPAPAGPAPSASSTSATVATAVALTCTDATRATLGGIDGCRFANVGPGQGVSLTIAANTVDKTGTATLLAVGDDGSVARRALSVAPVAASTETPPAELTLRTEEDELCEQFPVDFVGDDDEHVVFAQGAQGLAKLVVSRTTDPSGCQTRTLPVPVAATSTSSSSSSSSSTSSSTSSTTSSTTSAPTGSAAPAGTVWTRFAGTFEEIGSFNGTWDTNGDSTDGGELKLTIRRTSTGWVALGYLALGSFVASLLAFAGGRGRAVYTQRSQQKRKYANATDATEALQPKLESLGQGSCGPLPPDIARSIMVDWKYPPDATGLQAMAAQDLSHRHQLVNLTKPQLLFASSDVFVDGATFKRFSDGCDAWVAACTAAGTLSEIYGALSPADRQSPLGAAVLGAFASGPRSLDKPTLSSTAETATAIADLLDQIDRAREEAYEPGAQPRRGGIHTHLTAARTALTNHKDLSTAIPPDAIIELYKAIALFADPNDTRPRTGYEGLRLLAMSGSFPSNPDLMAPAPVSTGGVTVQLSAPQTPTLPPAVTAEQARRDAEAAKLRELVYVAFYTLAVFAAGILVGWVTTYNGKDVWGTVADRWTAFTWAFGSAAVLSLARYIDLPLKQPAKPPSA